MKSHNALLIAAAGLGLLLSSNHAAADDGKFLSPRGKANQPSVSSEPDTSSNTATPTDQPGSPRMRANRLTFSPAESSLKDPDLVRRQRLILYTGRSPFRDVTMRRTSSGESK